MVDRITKTVLKIQQKKWLFTPLGSIDKKKRTIKIKL